MAEKSFNFFNFFSLIVDLKGPLINTILSNFKNFILRFMSATEQFEKSPDVDKLKEFSFFLLILLLKTAYFRFLSNSL